MKSKNTKAPTEAQLIELAKRMLELSTKFPNNYDLGERVRSLHELAVSNPDLLINNQKDPATDESNKTISGPH